jgi:hypothetical protein
MVVNEQEYNWHSPDKHIPIGALVRFVQAPGRYAEEGWRTPGADLEGELAIIVDSCGSDSHNWGGVFMVNENKTGRQFMHWGDFMEIVNENK